ncbi:hypothetical protein L0337_10975 [candidate division KSB1 bacterium]|nr:hypothetical protein [candidate division KSB1 bacterium]
MSFCNAAFAGNLKYSVRGGLGDRWRPGELLDHGMLAGKSQLDLIVIVLKLRRDLHALGWKVREHREVVHATARIQRFHQNRAYGITTFMNFLQAQIRDAGEEINRVPLQSKSSAIH